MRSRRLWATSRPASKAVPAAHDHLDAFAYAGEVVDMGQPKSATADRSGHTRLLIAGGSVDKRHKQRRRYRRHSTLKLQGLTRVKAS
jgi:hypothetical protein